MTVISPPPLSFAVLERRDKSMMDTDGDFGFLFFSFVFFWLDTNLTAGCESDRWSLEWEAVVSST